MIEIIKDKKDIEEFFSVLKKRGAVNSGNFSDTVKKIVADIEKNGDAALEEYTKKFDNPNFDIKNIEINIDTNIVGIILIVVFKPKMIAVIKNSII